MPSDPDAVTAIRDFLKADSGVAAIASTRVFGSDLPRVEADSMPRAAIVVRPSGGGVMGVTGTGWSDHRVDIDCFGDTPYNAWLLHKAARAALRNMKSQVVGITLVKWAKSSSEGTLARDPVTDWPTAMSSWQVLISESPA